MKITFAIALSLISGMSAACNIIDTDEIGDIGPALDRVCRDLESHMNPAEYISIKNRRILSSSLVEFDIGTTRNKVTYQLDGISWKVVAID